MNDATDITIVLDRSGSMHAIREDTIGGFNRFLADQKAIDKPATLSLVLFDHEYTPLYVGRDLRAAEPLTNETYLPRGSTALCDAVGRTIVATGDRLRSMPEEKRPSRVLFVIVTDGLENSSQEYTRSMVRSMTRHQAEKYGWTFVYLGANQDAFSEAERIGIARNFAGNYLANAQSVGATYSTASNNIGLMRSAGVAAQNLSWNPTGNATAVGIGPIEGKDEEPK